MKSFIPDIPFFSIHLERESNRQAYMTHLQNTLGRQITTWKASEGTEVASRGWPRGHPHERETSIGALGCLDSHIRLLQHMITEKYIYMGIFEDDAECVVDISTLDSFFESANAQQKPWDILFLGANEWVDFFPSQRNLIQIFRFWGTHAFLIKADAARKIIQDHRDLLSKGYAYPADWLYAYSIQKHGLVAYGPTFCKGMIRQKPGLVSAINGKIRS